MPSKRLFLKEAHLAPQLWDLLRKSCCPISTHPCTHTTEHDLEGLRRLLVQRYQVLVLISVFWAYKYYIKIQALTFSFSLISNQMWKSGTRATACRTTVWLIFNISVSLSPWTRCYYYYYYYYPTPLDEQECGRTFIVSGRTLDDVPPVTALSFYRVVRIQARRWGCNFN